jgi:hypothetical protein
MSEALAGIQSDELGDLAHYLANFVANFATSTKPAQ